MNAPIIVVLLRQPDPNDMRSDPLYEFGSFGLTGCKRTKLLAGRSAAGARLAFAQGGDLGFRLVMLTPPIDVRVLANVREAFWSPAAMPLRYETAPVLIENDGSSDVDGMREMVGGVDCNTWREKFSSAFRGRTRPLDAAVAAAMARTWDNAIDGGGERAEFYWEALPYWNAAAVDRNRHGTYQTLMMAALGEAPLLDDDNGDDGDVNAAIVPAGASCRPRPARSEPSRGSSLRRRC